MHRQAWIELSDAVRRVAGEAMTHGNIEIVLSCELEGDKHRLRDSFRSAVMADGGLVIDPELPMVARVQGLTLRFEHAG